MTILPNPPGKSPRQKSIHQNEGPANGNLGQTDAEKNF